MKSSLKTVVGLWWMIKNTVLAIFIEEGLARYGRMEDVDGKWVAKETTGKSRGANCIIVMLSEN